MRNILLSLGLLGMVSAVQLTAHQAEGPIETFRINLDEPPRLRFVAPNLRFKNETLVSLVELEKVVDFYLNENAKTIVDYSFWLAQREHYLEMEGIATALGIDTRRIVLANFVYEYIAFCTSLLAKQVDGTILHVRMYDFIAPEETKKMLYIGEFYRNGSYLYSGVMHGATPFFASGFRNGSFSITMNQRNPSHSVDQHLANLGMMTYGYPMTFKLLRDTYDRC